MHCNTLLLMFKLSYLTHSDCVPPGQRRAIILPMVRVTMLDTGLSLLFLAGRRAIPIELYEATAIDGASALQNFRHVTFPLLRNLYLICTLLSMVFTLGDFTVPWLLTGGAPGDSTHVLATLAYRYTFQMGRLEWGLATFAVALPVTLGFIGLLLRWVKI